MNNAQVLVELLKEYGVEHIFGVPGDTTMVLYDAFYAARGEITHIMARDERSAAFMADAYARLTYKPGITEAPSGAVGAAFARPRERIVGLVGDGSFGMSGTELATIASLRLPITTILFNNGSFGWIKMLQRLYYGERYLGVDFTGKMDAVAIAEAFGIRGVRITHPDQLGPAIDDALNSNEPVFIDVPTKSELEEVPPVHAWQQALHG